MVCPPIRSNETFTRCPSKWNPAFVKILLALWVTALSNVLAFGLVDEKSSFCCFYGDLLLCTVRAQIPVVHGCYLAVVDNIWQQLIWYSLKTTREGDENPPDCDMNPPNSPKKPSRCPEKPPTYAPKNPPQK